MIKIFKKSSRGRTLLLGVAALLAIIFGLIYLLDMPARDVLQLLGASIILVLLIAIAGFVFSLLLHLLRRLLDKSDS